MMIAIGVIALHLLGVYYCYMIFIFSDALLNGDNFEKFEIIMMSLIWEILFVPFLIFLAIYVMLWSLDIFGLRTHHYPLPKPTPKRKMFRQPLPRPRRGSGGGTFLTEEKKWKSWQK